jgi:hypothetical protein
MLLYTSGMPFPGWAALPPCLGAAAIIATGSHGTTIVHRMLVRRALVWVGVISYSLYLWHWPMIVFVHYVTPAPALSFWTQMALLLSTFVVGYASWRWVEQPFRKARLSWRPVFAVAGFAILATSIAGLLAARLDGLPQRFRPEVVRLANALGYDPALQFREHSCFLRPRDSISLLNEKGCLSTRAGRANVLLIGNSHAAHLWQGLQRADPEVTVMQATASGWDCLPVLQSRSERRCRELWSYVFGEVLKRGGIDLIVISAPWQTHDLPALEATLTYLRRRSIPVLMVGATPHYSVPLPRLLAFAKMRNDPALPARYLLEREQKLDPAIEDIAHKHGATFIAPYSVLCPKQHCISQVNGMPIQFDVDHLTPEGSLLLGRSIVGAPAWRAARRASAMDIKS